MFETAVPWHERARCRDADPDLFFALAGQRTAIAEAKQICAACPVRAACLDQALADESLEGVWGGTTERERMAVRVRARIAARRYDVPA
ncbi:Transcriptional regulator WhiB [Actinomadura rubteroloni]|uniref:Transcriptional regulator WhiB n=1 Tax=Actinomadura rubteroloni TaxID=1926885 RepID=A0A2P4UGC7_9ACTN|nr:WhiB family transcriptional regulator [Actinomadura rubteroloni]POM24090.1 Transcriptional regulator WhiB [Actinomadura rubteroloni]